MGFRDREEEKDEQGGHERRPIVPVEDTAVPARAPPNARSTTLRSAIGEVDWR